MDPTPLLRIPAWIGPVRLLNMLRFLHLTRQISRYVVQRSVASPPHAQRVPTPAACRALSPSLSPAVCWYSSKVELTGGEKAIADKLHSRFPDAKTIEVSDISGGCGAMYQISIETEEFRGKRTVMQHRLVNEALVEEIKSMHGLQLNTKVPEDS